MARKPSGDKLTNQIIVRVDDETKEAFMSRATAEGKSASEIIKEFIQSYLAREPQQVPDLIQIRADVEHLKEKVAILENEAQKKLYA
ncbi:hypothetical protein WA1_18695 [Scytonema hofmannii PCC 7110]|uniref:Ribbon-helix-helix protein CopG domain-containing protein n=1 Tax=Scytonema hofmannii PCC 7110 TaxID=128403 RepID=A0A139XBK7_9CYAN|nr:ribbon-helix-helix protein, CopG family [Scytonema hofmannii]KYC42033.1 hypothetical protein WA1_18695 [Scytonema hofmannii PCC 7110]